MMGGNAFPNAVRMSKTTYLEESRNIYRALEDAGLVLYIPPSYEGKSSFGDIDVLLRSNIPGNTVSRVSKAFPEAEMKIFSNPKRRHRHRQIPRVFRYSFLYKGTIQVDLIELASTPWVFFKEYYSYNGLWGLIGKIARRFGLRLRENGLYYPIITEDGVRIQELGLSDISIKSILSILRFDYTIYSRGFKSMEDIFKFVISSRHFCSNLFSIEYLGKERFQKNLKMKVFREFIIWLHKTKTQGAGKEEISLYQKYLIQDDLIKYDRSYVMTEMDRSSGYSIESWITSSIDEFKTRARSKFILDPKIAAEVTGLRYLRLSSFLEAFSSTGLYREFYSDPSISKEQIRLAMEKYFLGTYYDWYVRVSRSSDPYSDELPDVTMDITMDVTIGEDEMDDA